MPQSRNAASSLKVIVDRLVVVAASVGSIAADSIVVRLDLVLGQLGVVRARRDALLGHALVAGDREPVARPRHRDVEEAPLVGVAALVARARRTRRAGRSQS